MNLKREEFSNNSLLSSFRLSVHVNPRLSRRA
jgi:hypothetical protein